MQGKETRMKGHRCTISLSAAWGLDYRQEAFRVQGSSELLGGTGRVKRVSSEVMQGYLGLGPHINSGTLGIYTDLKKITITSWSLLVGGGPTEKIPSKNLYPGR